MKFREIMALTLPCKGRALGVDFLDETSHVQGFTHVILSFKLALTPHTKWT